MLLPGSNSPKSWLFITILVTLIIALCESSGGKTLNIKLGFDLTQGSNGAPSLRIRDFEDSQYNPRALDVDSSSDDGSQLKAGAKDGSDSSGPDVSKKADSSKDVEVAKSSDDNEGDRNSGGGERVTRGLNAGDFEPEDNPKLHGRYQKSSESDNDDDRRRHKRQVVAKHR